MLFALLPDKSNRFLAAGTLRMKPNRVINNSPLPKSLVECTSLFCNSRCNGCTDWVRRNRRPDRSLATIRFLDCISNDFLMFDFWVCPSFNMECSSNKDGKLAILCNIFIGNRLHSGLIELRLKEEMLEQGDSSKGEQQLSALLFSFKSKPASDRESVLR